MLLYRRSVHFGVVPVPNLCVELRGYDAAEEAPASASTSGHTHHGNDNNGVATASVTAGQGWHGWGEGKARFLELQRTGEPDGSFIFVTPETGLLLVLAAYPNGGGNPIVRVFPGDPRGASGFDQGAARGSNGGEASAFGTDSGRVQMHIDLAEGGSTHAPGVMWSAAAREREKDRSPCARREAAVTASGKSGAARGGNEAGADAAHAAHDGGARQETGQSERQRGRWALGEKFSRIYHGIGGGDGGDGSDGDGEQLDQATAAMVTLLRSSRQYFGEFGSGCWEASAAACAMLRSGLEAYLETAWQHLHQRVLAASEWLLTLKLSSRLAIFSPTTMLLSTWLWRTPAKSKHFSSAWFSEVSALLLSWFEQWTGADWRAWWSVWWVKVGATAVCLGLLQEVFQVFVAVYKYFGPPAEVAVAGRRFSGSPRQDEDEDPAATTATSTLVGTFHSSDGTVSQLRVNFGKPGHSAEPATFERKRKRGFGAVRGGSGSSSSSGSKLADDVSGGIQQDTDDHFSSMFRALSQTSCSGTGRTDEDDIDGGATSNVVVVTQQSW